MTCRVTKRGLRRLIWVDGTLAAIGHKTLIRSLFSSSKHHGSVPWLVTASKEKDIVGSLGEKNKGKDDVVKEAELGATWEVQPGEKA